MATGTSEHAHIEANDIAVHTVSVGRGPLVAFCHGFPESWYSWRRQLPAVAEAIRSDPDWQGGDYKTEPVKALTTVADITLLAPKSAPIYMQQIAPTGPAAAQCAAIQPTTGGRSAGTRTG